MSEFGAKWLAEWMDVTTCDWASLPVGECVKNNKIRQEKHKSILLEKQNLYHNVAKTARRRKLKLRTIIWKTSDS